MAEVRQSWNNTDEMSKAHVSWQRDFGLGLWDESVCEATLEVSEKCSLLLNVKCKCVKYRSVFCLWCATFHNNTILCSMTILQQTGCVQFQVWVSQSSNDNGTIINVYNLRVGKGTVLKTFLPFSLYFFVLAPRKSMQLFWFICTVSDLKYFECGWEWPWSLKFIIYRFIRQKCKKDFKCWFLWIR